MAKLIDLNGLDHFWDKVKAWVSDNFLSKSDAPEGSTPYDSNPQMDGTASAGSSNAFARGDHRHPSDTNKQDAIADLDTIRSGATAGASAIPMPSGGSVGQVLKKTADGTEWANESGGGGTSDYSNLTNKPQINSVTLSGNKSLSDLGIAAAADIPIVPTKLSEFTDDLGTSPTHSHSQYLTSHQDITGKADKVSSATNGNFAALDSNGNLTDSGHKHSDYLTSHQDISGKADKATTLAGYGITDAKIDNGVITLGSNTITPLTSHQSLSGYATETWVGQQGYLTQHQDISGKQDKSNLVTSLSSSSTDAQYPSARCVYDIVGDIETLLAAI